MRQAAFQRFSFHAVGPVTKWLCIAILAVSLVGAVTQRNFGFGIHNLQYNMAAIFELELWRLLTYPLVESSTLGLLLGLVVLWLFGGYFERHWGSRDFLKFVILSCVGAGILAIPLSYLINAIGLFRDFGIAEGPGPAINAMLVALAVVSPNTNVLLGFVLPIRARTIIIILLSLEVISGIQTGAASLSISLGGMLMGYLLVTGNWRPNRLFARFKRRRPRRRGLYVVPPKDHDHTLH